MKKRFDDLWRLMFCGVELEFDAELGLLHGMYDSMEADGIPLFAQESDWPIKVHVDNKGIIDGLWRGERKCIDPKAGDAALWIKIWEELHLLMSKEIMVEVEHVKAHRTKKDKKDMSHFERFVTDGNEEAVGKGRSNVGRRIYGGSEGKDSPATEKKCMQPCSMRPDFTVW